MNLQQAIRDVFTKHDGVLSIAEVQRKIREAHGDRWVGGSISAHLA